MIKGRLEFLFTGECKAFLVLDSEDFFAVVPPIAMLHVDELINVKHKVTIVVVRFNRLLENLSGNFFAVLVVELIHLINVKILIVR